MHAKEAAILWLAGFKEACSLHRVVILCIRFFFDSPSSIVLISLARLPFVTLKLPESTFPIVICVLGSDRGHYFLVLPSLHFQLCTEYTLFVLTAAGTHLEQVVDSVRRSFRGGGPKKLHVFYAANKIA
ncbi:hypothetical protein B296_00016408 [Ensete ventricosum]|uniref:Uncharacterized protein n=1 Tax=Ensete ventricosum TaxID=4639 RepID=A0A427ALR6_ENSVE|nr:hypothetical protein B296_00016408 [Ensete ventricosum]